MSTAGRYKHVTKLGEGTYGSVYKATERASGKTVAFKRMVVSSEDEGVPGTAIREICLLKELQHDHIVHVYEVLFESPKITLIFELCDYDLKQYMATKKTGKLDCEREVRPMLRQMFSGLRYMHARSVVHRDMKPQNIFLNVRPIVSSQQHPSGPGSPNASSPAAGSPVNPTSGKRLGDAASGSHAAAAAATTITTAAAVEASSGKPELVVKLGDFGLARVERIPVKKYSHEVVTLWYRSPDVMMGSALYSFPVDMWSMGAIFFEMITGQVLFNGRNEDEQMLRVFVLLGSPTMETWPSLRTYPGTRERLERLRGLSREHMSVMGSSAAAAVNSAARSSSRSSSSHAVPGIMDLPVLTAPTPATPPRKNTYGLPKEMWFEFPLFDEYMDRTGFRDAVGAEGVDLLRRCLAYEPAHRLTAAEAMQHPFLRHVRSPSSGSVDELMLTLSQTLASVGL